MKAERSKRLIAEQWPVFTEAVLSRLDAGAALYGDKSLDADTERLISEVQDELLDVMGWGFLLWAKMQAIQAKLNSPQAIETGSGDRA